MQPKPHGAVQVKGGIALTSEELLIKLTETDARSRRNEGRVRELEANQESLRRLTTAVEVMAGEQQHQTARMQSLQTDVHALDGKVDALERKPGRRWESMAEKLLLVILSAAITFVLTRIGLG